MAKHSKFAFKDIFDIKSVNIVRGIGEAILRLIGKGEPGDRKKVEKLVPEEQFRDLAKQPAWECLPRSR